MPIVLIGVNHRTAPLELRERLAFTAGEAARAAAELRAGGFREALVLSTCNRSEVYAVSPATGPEAAATLERYLALFHAIAPEELRASVYRAESAAAVAHLFRVTAGLDSMLLGEAEIIGQVREAYKRALHAGTTGPYLNRLFQSALETGKRVRAETDLGTRPMSVAFAAVKLAEQIFGSLKSHRALILGAGKVGEQVLEHLLDRGLPKVTIINRSRQHAERLAQSVGGEVAGWETLAAALAAPDIVVASVASPEPVLTGGLVAQAMAARKNRALFLIDLGVPRNVETAAEDLYNVYLYNLDNLAQIVEENRRARQNEVPRAEAIVAEQAAKFEAWEAHGLMLALLEELKEKLRHEQEAFLEQHREQIRGLSTEDRQRFGALAEELLEQLVAEPAGGRAARKGPRPRAEQLEAVRRFFGLAGEEP